MINVADLKSVAFTGAPVRKEIEWEMGGEKYNATVYIRPLGYRSAVSDLAAIRGNGDAVAGRIAASICDEKGNAVFTVEDITGEADPSRGALDGHLTMALLAAIGEVNQLGKQPS